MNKAKLLILPFALGALLASCGNSGGNVTGLSASDNSPATGLSASTKDPSLNITEKTIKVDEEFRLVINDIPEGETPVWSAQGTAISFTIPSPIKADTAIVKGLEEGNATLTIIVGQKTLTCVVTVTAK